jgi:hypothetical protein
VTRFSGRVFLWPVGQRRMQVDDAKRLRPRRELVVMREVATVIKAPTMSG